MRYDIVIIGAGPAGSILASLLKPSYKVLLVDRRNFNETSNHQKSVCCGGLLAPDAQKAIAHLGFSIPKEVLVSPQMFAVKTLDFDNDLERYYQRYYINVNRELFDRFLASRTTKNVEKLYDTEYQRYEELPIGYKIHLKKAGKDICIESKIVVGADGAISKIRELAFKGQAMPDKYISLQKWYQAKEVSPHFYSIFDREISDFYSWLIEKDGQILLGTALKNGKKANQKFQLLENKIRTRGILKNKALKTEGTYIMRTRRLNQIHLTKDNIALIGEAAGFISPSSAEGISYAIRSGQYLAEALNADLENFAPIYTKKCKKLKFNIFLKNIKLHAMYQPTLRKWIMKSGLLSMSLYKQ